MLEDTVELAKENNAMLVAPFELATFFKLAKV